MMEIKTIAILGAIVVIALAVIATGSNFYTTHEEDITVKSKYIDPEEDHTNYMLITEDGRVFEVDYNYLAGQFSIDKEWAELEENKTFHIYYCGWEVHYPFWDWYYRIYRVEPTTTAG